MLLLILKILLQIFAVATAFLGYRLDYVTHDKRTRAFKLGRCALLISSPILLLLRIVVLTLDDLDKKKDIERLSKDIERLAQPIQDVYISVMFKVPAANNLFSNYLDRLKPAITELASSPHPKRYLIVQGREKDGSITSVRIPPQSPFFPNKDTEKPIYSILNTISLISSSIQHIFSSKVYRPPTSPA